MAISLKAFVTGGLIWYLISDVDLSLVGLHIAKVDWRLLALSLVIFSVQIVIGGFRWGTVLDSLGTEVRRRLTIHLFYIGGFFNQALPGGSGGDAVRMYLSYRHGFSFRNAVNSVIIERIAAVLSLVVLVDVIQFFFIRHLSSEMKYVTYFGTTVVTLLAIFCFIFLIQLERLSEKFKKSRFVRGLGNLGADTRRVFFSVQRLWRPVMWGLLGHLNISLAVFILTIGMGLDVTLFDCVVLIPPVLLILTLPISIGGWGIREGAMIWAFALIGVTNEEALVLSVLFGLSTLAITLPGGLIWLMTRQPNDKGAFAFNPFKVLNNRGENS